MWSARGGECGGHYGVEEFVEIARGPWCRGDGELSAAVLGGPAEGLVAEDVAVVAPESGAVGQELGLQAEAVVVVVPGGLGGARNVVAGRLHGAQVEHYIDELTDLDRLPAPLVSRLVELIEAPLVQWFGAVPARAPPQVGAGGLWRAVGQ